MAIANAFVLITLVPSSGWAPKHNYYVITGVFEFSYVSPMGGLRCRRNILKANWLYYVDDIILIGLKSIRDNGFRADTSSHETPRTIHKLFINY